MPIADLHQSSFPAAFAFCLGGPCHCYLRGSDFFLVKDYLQPAATLALALAIASLPFTVPMGVKAYGDLVTIDGRVVVQHWNSCAN